MCLGALIGVALVAMPAEAGMLDGSWNGPELRGGLLERFFEWVLELWEPSPAPFVAEEGASITGNG